MFASTSRPDRPGSTSPCSPLIRRRQRYQGNGGGGKVVASHEGETTAKRKKIEDNRPRQQPLSQLESGREIPGSSARGTAKGIGRGNRCQLTRMKTEPRRNGAMFMMRRAPAQKWAPRKREVKAGRGSRVGPPRRQFSEPTCQKARVGSASTKRVAVRVPCIRDWKRVELGPRA